MQDPKRALAFVDGSLAFRDPSGRVCGLPSAVVCERQLGPIPIEDLVLDDGIVEMGKAWSPSGRVFSSLLVGGVSD